MAKFEMSPLIVRWLDKQVRHNMWRMPKWMSEEDVRQEGMVYWVAINNRYHQPSERYPQGVTDIKHMMSLFMVSFRHHLHDLAADRPSDECNYEDLRVGEVQDVLGGIASNDPDVNGAILEAPEPVQSILRLLVTDTRRNLAAYARIYLDGRRDTLNLRLYRALRRQGFDVTPAQDFMGMARCHLANERQPLYEPTVLEMVGAMVESYINQPKRPILRLDAKSAPYNLEQRIVRRTKRVTLTPTVEVVYVRRGPANHTAPGVRRRTSYTKSRIKVPQHSWSSLRPRMHGYWTSSGPTWGQQPRHDCGLQRPQADNERSHRERLGPRDAGMGGGRDTAPCIARDGAGPQNGDVALHSNGGATDGIRCRLPSSTATEPRPQIDASEAVRDAQLLG